MTKTSTSTPIITLAVANVKDNLYSKPRIGNCYRCGELGHKSNECRKRIQVTMVDYEEKDDVLIETELEGSDFVGKHGDPAAYIVQKVLYNQKVLTPHNNTKFSIQGVRSRIKYAIFSLTMGAARISCQKHSWII